MSGGRMGRPDVVFFMVDQLSAKWLEAALGGVVPVPNIERLMSRGTTFTDAITSNPVCMATRATIATGLTTRGHGVLENGYQLDPKLPTFMRVLQQAGWRTGALGKVHLVPHFAGLRPDFRPYGFEVTHITEDSRGGEWLDWAEREHPGHFESVLATIWPSRIPDYAKCGAGDESLRERIESARKGFRWATPEFPLNTAGRYTLPFPEEVSQTNWITGHALEFLKDTPRDRPLLAHVSYVQPHSPFSAPADYMTLVDVDRIPEPVPAEWASDPHAPRELSRRKPSVPAPDEWRYSRQLYFADIAHLDRQLGRVLDCLEETGRIENAYVIFLSDHGEMFFDHGLTGKEEKHYDACIRVPLIVAGPGLAEGITRDELVQLEDICPTVLDMTGLAMPPMPKTGPYLKVAAEDIPVLPGRSLLPLCRGEKAADWRDAAYSESYNHINSAHASQWARTVRTKDFRYTFYPDGGGEQLFDLGNDPDEQRNLAADPGHAETRRELRDRLMELIVMQDYPKTRRELFALGVH